MPDMLCMLVMSKIMVQILDLNTKPQLLLLLHGAQIKNAKCLKHYQNFNTNAILTCNTAMEREFYGLSRDVFKNYEIYPIKHKFEYFLQLPELANAHLGFNFKF